MELGLVIIVTISALIILVLLLGGNSSERKHHESQDEFTPNSALRRVVYNVRPGCAEAAGVYKRHSDRKSLENTG